MYNLKSKKFLVPLIIGVFFVTIFLSLSDVNNKYIENISMENITRVKNLTVFEKKQIERKAKMRQYCDMNHEEKMLPYRSMRTLLIDKRDKLAWCPICKAGSTIWMKIFAILGGQLPANIKLPNPLIKVSELARKAFPYIGHIETMEAITQNSIIKFIIVRHPFERLLSAFRDKLQDKRKWYYHKNYGKYIINWYRKDSKMEITPTFEEFLRYIITEKNFDEHWSPYVEQCAPCFVEYDYIFKTETLDSELIPFLQKVIKYDYTKVYKHRENVNSAGKTDSEKIKREYYSSIPIELLKEVYKIYEKDFIIFDYSPDQYFKWARKNNIKKQITSKKLVDKNKKNN